MKIKVAIKYRIYAVEHGLLLKPKSSGYGGYIDKYDDANSIDEATKLITDNKDWNEYVILPITNTYQEK